MVEMSRELSHKYRPMKLMNMDRLRTKRIDKQPRSPERRVKLGEDQPHVGTMRYGLGENLPFLKLKLVGEVVSYP